MVLGEFRVHTYLDLLKLIRNYSDHDLMFIKAPVPVTLSWGIQHYAQVIHHKCIQWLRIIRRHWTIKSLNDYS